LRANPGRSLLPTQEPERGVADPGQRSQEHGPFDFDVGDAQAHGSGSATIRPSRRATSAKEAKGRAAIPWLSHQASSSPLAQPTSARPAPQRSESPSPIITVRLARVASEASRKPLQVPQAPQPCPSGDPNSGTRRRPSKRAPLA